MKPIRNPFATAFVRQFVLTGSVALASAMPAANAATFIYNSTTSGTTQWSAGTNWDATPVSAATTTLTLGNAAALAAADAIVSNNNIAGDFKLNILNMTYAGPLSGAAPTVTLTGNSLEFITDVATPTMVVNSTGTVKPVLVINNPILLTSDLAVTATTNATFGGLVSGSGKLSKAGTGILALTGLANSYTGNTTISAGVLEVGDLTNGSLGVGGLLFSGGVLQGNGTFTRNFSGAATAANNEIAGLIGGFSAKGGPLTVNFGGAAAAVTLSGGATTPKFGNGFTLNSSSANNKVTVVNSLNLNNAVRVFSVNTGSGGDSAELSGVLTGSTTTSGLNKAGQGALILSNSNTYTGLTTVSTGTLVISNANALGAAALAATNNTTTVLDAARLQLIDGVIADANESLAIAGTGGGIPAGALQAGAGGGTWSGPISLFAAARIGAAAGSTLTVTGTIANGTGSIGTAPATVSAAATGVAFSGISGTGVVILNPTTANTYTGQTNLVRGILRLGKNDALPVTTVIDAKDGANAVDATVLDLAGFNQTITGLFDTSTTVFNNVITNSVAATTSILTINNAAGRIYDGFIENGAGTVALVKGGASTQTLNGANSYSGSTTINVGGLTIGNNTALGNTTGSTTIVSTGTTTTGGRLNLSANITSAENLLLTGNSEQAGGFNATLESISGANTLTGNITLVGTGGQRINATAPGVEIGILNLNGPIARDGTNIGALVLRTGTTTSTLNVNNSIDLNGSGINVQGLGTVVMNAASTDFTSTNIAFGATSLVLKLGASDVLPVAADLIIGTSNTTAGTDQGALDLAGFNQSIRGLTGVRSAGVTPADASQRRITNSGGTLSTLTAGTGTIASNFSTFDGVIENGIGLGGVAVTKVGAGTITLPATNTYTGATLVSAGTLRVNGSLAAGSAVTVDASGTLAGTGTVNGGVTASGTIAPGSGGVGTLTTGTTALSGTLAVQIDGATADKLTSTGTLTLSGPLTVSLLAGGFSQPSYVIAEGASLSGTFSSVPSGYSVNYSGTQATLSQITVTDYDTWATSFGLQNPWLGVNPALNGVATADPDGDGLANQQEYAFGLVPTSGSSVSPITVQLDKTAGTFSYTRRATPTLTGLAYTVKTSQDLVTWVTDASANQAVTGTAGGVQTVQVTLSGAPLTASKLFVRVEAQ